jgi:ribosomal protein L32
MIWKFGGTRKVSDEHFAQLQEEEKVMTKKDNGEEPKPTLWERFDKHERGRRISEFIKADKEKVRREHDSLKPINDRPTNCRRCGQGHLKHKITTLKPCSEEYQIIIREGEDGELKLDCVPHYWPRYGYRYITGHDYTPRVPENPIFIRKYPMRLQVTCECGCDLGTYQPLANV